MSSYGLPYSAKTSRWLRQPLATYLPRARSVILQCSSAFAPLIPRLYVHIRRMRSRGSFPCSTTNPTASVRRGRGWAVVNTISPHRLGTSPCSHTASHLNRFRVVFKGTAAKWQSHENRHSVSSQQRIILRTYPRCNFATKTVYEIIPCRFCGSGKSSLYLQTYFSCRAALQDPSGTQHNRSFFHEPLARHSAEQHILDTRHQGHCRCPSPRAFFNFQVDYMVSVLPSSASHVSLPVAYGTPAPSLRRDKAFLKQD